MADRDYSKIGNSLRVSLLLLLAASFLSFASSTSTYAKSAGETLADYSRLPDKERESKIVEGAKREGAPVDISLLQPVLSVPTYLLLAKNATHPHSAALFLDWALSRDGIMKVLAEELGRGVPRTGYKDIFPELNAEQYLVVEPTKVGPRYEEFQKLYCGIFKHC